MNSTNTRRCPRCDAIFDESVNYCLNDGERLPPLSDLIGRVLDDRYRIEGIVGRGGMGVVYRATHIHIDAPVAVKVLNPDLVANQSAIERFRREARAAGRIDHPNAIQVKDFGVTRDQVVYLVMELVEGKSLRALIREEKYLRAARAVNLLVQTCSAVEAAHDSGVIHRDLKPDNILVRRNGAAEEVKVGDFGIAKLKHREGLAANSLTLTEAGAILGTPTYMSPEQCRGQELDIHSDIYSLGVIAHEMLSGKYPFEGDTPAEIIAKHLRDDPPPLRGPRPELPAEIEQAVLRALAKDPAQRPQSAVEFGQELLAAVRNQELGTLASGSATPPERQPSDRDSTGAVRVTNYQPKRMTAGTEIEATRVLTADPLATARAGSPARRLSSILVAAIGLAVIAFGVFGAILLWQSWRDNRSGAPNHTSGHTSGNASVAPEGMALIPGGKFLLGRNDGEQDEGPAREVAVTSFYLDKYEVANQQYKKFTDATGRAVPQNWKDNGSFAPEERLLPVTFVTWRDAADYAQWAGKRLPTEEEWEYAARGGASGNLYPWGAPWAEGRANINRPRLAPGGSFESDLSPFGIYDLAGNVSEWVQNHYRRRYDARPEEQYRVYRGGNFTAGPKESSATYRWYDYPSPPADPKDKREYDLKVFPVVGFRCAKDADR